MQLRKPEDRSMSLLVPRYAVASMQPAGQPTTGSPAAQSGLSPVDESTLVVEPSVLAPLAPLVASPPVVDDALVSMVDVVAGTSFADCVGPQAMWSSSASATIARVRSTPRPRIPLTAVRE
jgi:hypothetical protein